MTARGVIINGNVHNITSLVHLQNTVVMYGASIVELSLRGCDLSSLPHDLFHGLYNLEYLDLSYNQLEEIDVDAFSDLHKLRYLSLKHNHFCSTRLLKNPQLFAPFQDTIEELDLSFNKITVSGSDPIIPVFLSKLQSLHLDSNPLSQLGENVLLNTPWLRTLFLTQCNIHAIHPLAFEKTPYLHTLELSQNKFTTTTLPRLQLPYLEELWFGSVGDEVDDIPPSFFKEIPSLKKLSFCGTAIEKLHDDVFCYIPKLEVLNLSNHPNLTQIKRSVFRYTPRLERVILDNNGIDTCTMDTLDDLNQIKYFSMKGGYGRIDGDVVAKYILHNANTQHQ